MVLSLTLSPAVCLGCISYAAFANLYISVLYQDALATSVMRPTLACDLNADSTSDSPASGTTSSSSSSSTRGGSTASIIRVSTSMARLSRARSSLSGQRTPLDQKPRSNRRRIFRSPECNVVASEARDRLISGEKQFKLQICGMHPSWSRAIPLSLELVDPLFLFLPLHENDETQQAIPKYRSVPPPSIFSGCTCLGEDFAKCQLLADL